MHRTARIFTAPIMALLFATLVSCGGGGNSPPPTDPDYNNNPTLKLVTTTLPVGVVGRPYSATLTATGNVGAVTWQVDSLPEGLTLDAKGTISGTPTRIASMYLRVRVTDSAKRPETVEQTILLSIVNVLRIDSTPAVGATRGVPINRWLATSVNGHAPFDVTVTGLPAGVTAKVVQREVSLTGTPSDSGAFQVHVTVKDSVDPPQTATVDIPMFVDTSFTLVPSPLPLAIVGRSYTGQIAAVNGTPPYTWAASSPFPAGLSLDPQSGLISGNPEMPGWKTLSFTVTDSSNPPLVLQGNKDLGIYDRLRVDNPELETARYNEPYMEGLRVNGGVGLVTATYVSGELPPGVSFSSPWTLIGVPTKQGTFTFGFELKDGAEPPQVWRQLYSLTVLPPAVNIPLQMLPEGVLGRNYEGKLYGEKGTPPFTWSSVSGLPPGITLSASGGLTGTPETVGTFRPKFVVTDSASPAQTDTMELELRVNAQPLRRNDTIATATPISGYVGNASISPYADPIDTANPDTDYYKLIAPAGGQVKIDVWSYNALDPVLEIVDGNGVRFKTCINLADYNPPTDLIQKDQNDTPDDECINDDAEIGNTSSSRLTFYPPGEPGTQTTFYAHVLDFRGDARPDMTYYMRIEGSTPILNVQTAAWGANLLPVGLKGQSYSGYLDISGGTGTRTASITTGTLPPGLSMSTAGVVTGIPSAAGTYNFTVQVVDSGNPAQTATVQAKIVVVAPLTITTDSVAPGTTGQSYSVSLAAEGGQAPYSWNMEGTFPKGLKIGRETATIYGVPEEVGQFNFWASVTDSLRLTTSRYVSMQVSPGPLYFPGITLADGYVGWGYEVKLTARGGTPSLNQLRVLAYRWALASGSLPPGLELRSDGALTGRPTTAGTYSFTVQVTDAATPAQVATGVVTITVRPSP